MTVPHPLKAPFPYHGAKHRHATDVWQRFGKVNVYSEPFAGTLAVLLNRPELPARGIEIANDRDCLVTNFWRAVKHDPDLVAHFADWVSSAVEMEARFGWVNRWVEEQSHRVGEADDYVDHRIAGYWAYLKSTLVAGRWTMSRPTSEYGGVHNRNYDVGAWLGELSKRLRHTILLAGDWEASVTTAMMRTDRNNPPYGVFLDPPYLLGERKDLYLSDSEGDTDTTAEASYQWAVAHGKDERYRIAYCMHKGDFPVPSGWTSLTYTFAGIQREDRRLRRDEIIFSPHCGNTQQSLLAS